MDDIHSLFADTAQEGFTEISYNQKPFIGVDVMNHCSEEILIAFHYKDKDDAWIFDGHYPVASNELFISPVTSTSTNIYYQAQTRDRSIVWSGDEAVKNDRDQTFMMKHISAETRFYDHRLEIHCN